MLCLCRTVQKWVHSNKGFLTSNQLPTALADPVILDCPTALPSSACSSPAMPSHPFGKGETAVSSSSPHHRRDTCWSVEGRTWEQLSNASLFLQPAPCTLFDRLLYSHPGTSARSSSGSRFMLFWVTAWKPWSTGQWVSASRVVMENPGFSLSFFCPWSKESSRVSHYKITPCLSQPGEDHTSLRSFPHCLVTAHRSWLAAITGDASSARWHVGSRLVPQDESLPLSGVVLWTMACLGIVCSHSLRYANFERESKLSLFD